MVAYLEYQSQVFISFVATGLLLSILSHWIKEIMHPEQYLKKKCNQWYHVEHYSDSWDRDPYNWHLLLHNWKDINFYNFLEILYMADIYIAPLPRNNQVGNRQPPLNPIA